MNQKPPVTPAQQLVELIDRNANHTLVRVSPLAQVLPALRQYIVTTEARLAALEKPK
jgi:hypothetical protein